MLAAAPNLWIPQSAGLQIASSSDVIEHYFANLEVKALDTSGRTIEAYVAAFGDPVTAQGADRNRDIIVKGAFARSLATKRAIPLIGHDLEALRIGRCIDAHEDDYGLYTKTYVYETTAGNDLLETARQSLIEQDPLGNSIGYKVVDFAQAFIRGVVYRILKQIDWVEYSYLATRNIAANPAARTLSVKSLVPTIRGPEEHDMAALTNPEARAALIEQRKSFGMSDTGGVDLALIGLGEQLLDQGTRAVSDLLAMRQLGLETKDDSRMSPTVFTAVNDIRTKLGELINEQPAGVPGADDTETDEPGEGTPEEELNDCLAQMTDLTMSYKQAHWNITGPLFSELHNMFDMFSWQGSDWVDRLAERVVQLGGTAAGTLQATLQETDLPPFPVAARDAATIISALVERVDMVAEAIEDLADDFGGDDLTTQNILLTISEGIQKHQWQLRATNGQLGPPADAADADVVAAPAGTMAAQDKPEIKAVPPGDGTGDDASTMADGAKLEGKTAPKETGTPGGTGSDGLPYSRDSHQTTGTDTPQGPQARNRGGEPGAANAALGGRTRRPLRRKVAPPEHGTPGSFDPAGMSTPGHETAAANDPPETKVYSGPSDPKLPQNVQDADETARAQWVKVWNSAHAAAVKRGMSPKQAESKAFAQANGVLGKRETKAADVKPPMPEYQGESKDAAPDFHDETKWAPEVKAAVDEYMRTRSADELSKVKHFAWNENGEQSYPIENAADVGNAARAIGRLKGGKATDSERARLKENIIRIAKQVGGESGLPANWKALADLEKPEEKKVAPAESTLDSDDDMNAKALSSGTDESGGFLTRKSEVDLDLIDLGLMALSVGVSIRG